MAPNGVALAKVVLPGEVRLFHSARIRIEPARRFLTVLVDSPSRLDEPAGAFRLDPGTGAIIERAGWPRAGNG